MQTILKRLKIIKSSIENHDDLIMQMQIKSIRKFLIDSELKQILNNITNDAESKIITKIDAYLLANKYSTLHFEIDESNTIEMEDSKYSGKLESIKNMTFEKIRRVSMNYIDNEENFDQDNMHLYKYMNAYGKRDKALLYSSFDLLFEEIPSQKVNIIDWGSEQAIATTILLDYLREKQFDVRVEDIVLVSKDANKLKRAMLHCNILKNRETKIIGIYKGYKNISKNEIKVSSDSININLIYINNELNCIPYIENLNNVYILALSPIANDHIVNEFIKNYSEKYNVKVISSRNDKIGRFQRTESMFSYSI